MTDMDYHDEDFLPSEEEMDEIWDFLIEQTKLGTPFGQAVKSELNSLPRDPTTIFWVCLLQAVNRKVPVPRSIIEYYRGFMDKDQIDPMNLSKLIVADE
ncbi:hypothetical protein [Varibaculum massiliense]|uniref:hypothetical protein n=1 Tax=Varibaculum massiliense TaxID=1852372 RepID=UPI00116001DE|nr:hypothetical protein [Varibaculum massiliense]